VSISPSIQAGQGDGEGDLTVEVERRRPYAFSIGWDNAGTSSTGQQRSNVAFDLNSPFMLGDQLKTSILGSGPELVMGSVSYSAPIGVEGLRVNLGYSETQYALAGAFQALGASGKAKTSTAGFTLPVLHSATQNVSIAGGYKYSDLTDERSAVNSNFDSRSGGGMTYGSVSYTSGTLDMDAVSSAADSAGTKGSWDKLTFDIVDIESLSAHTSIYGHFSGQQAFKNLDSSESISIGGPQGVRAYASGEASGDSGAIIQLEARYDYAGTQQFVFYDAATVSTRVNPSPLAGNNTRDLSGAGVGVRFASGGVSIDVALAWRLNGGQPVTSSGDQPLAWVNATYRF